MQNVLIRNGRRLILLDNNTKPLLRLGKQDRGAVWKLSKENYAINKKISDYEYELGLPGLSSVEKSELLGKIRSMNKMVKDNDAQIRQIKIAAYQEQLNNSTIDYLG